MILQPSPHVPVMLNEVLHYIQPQDNETYIDGTFGAGGYSKALLDSKNCTIYAIDRDPDVKPTAESFAKIYGDRFHFIPGNFGDIGSLLGQVGEKTVDAIVLDLGVSSMQLDQAHRGFSFSKEAHLDMRMSQNGQDAYHLVNYGQEEELADIIYYYGEERLARRIASRIVRERQKKPITTTLELASIIKSVTGPHKGKIDPATKTFQAIRIWVNDELEELKRALEASERILKNGGRLVVVSFHSLEDSIVKSYFNDKSGKNISVSRYQPTIEDNQKEISLALLTKNAVKPSDNEIHNNPRARSARLRAAKRLRKS